MKTLSALILAFAMVPASLAATPATGPTVDQMVGINIHFVEPRPGVMKMITGAFTTVRMDIHWARTEKVKGQYDFSEYDRLVSTLEEHNMRAIFILCYGNQLYEPDKAVRTEAGRKAFAAWAAAGVQHFKGRGIMWEMWNEPNIAMFWKPKPNVQEYTDLALEVGKAIRQAAPDEQYIGPASAHIDVAFLEACFKAGLLEYWSAVSVHPYRMTNPETVEVEYARLRQMIDRYAPKGKHIPIISGEWGYPAVQSWMGPGDEAKQGRLLPRQGLINVANHIPISIWYDWSDDGKDPKNFEHHCGTVRFEYDANKDPVHEPKPAYLAAKTLADTLRGFVFVRRLAASNRADDYVLLFAKGEQQCLAVWTTADKPREVLIPANPGSFAVTSYLGTPMPALSADAKGLSVIASQEVQYLVPQRSGDVLGGAPTWRPPAPAAPATSTTTRNPL